jgi:hypothetical protein
VHGLPLSSSFEQKPYWQGLVAQSVLTAQRSPVGSWQTPFRQAPVVAQSAFVVQPLHWAATQLPVEQSMSWVQ